MRSFAIIPAAGRSTRLGEPKLLLPWRGTTLIEHVLGIWQAGGVAERMVIVRPDDDQLAAAVTRAGATICQPPVAPPEMKDSIVAGLVMVEELFHPSPNDVWLLAPGDMPNLSSDLIRALLAAAKLSDAAVLVPRSAGRNGHPVVFRWTLSAAAATVRTGMRELVERHTPEFLDWPDASCFDDLDTPADYRRLHDR